MRQPLPFLLVFVSSLFALPAIAFSGDEVRQTIPVQFAVLFDNGDPIAGSATCTIGMHCELLQTQLPAMEISLKVDTDNDRLISVLEMHCRNGCSFSNGQTNVTSTQERQFAVYESDASGRDSLVLRPPVRIGQILLSYPGCKDKRFHGLPRTRLI